MAKQYGMEAENLKKYIEAEVIKEQVLREQGHRRGGGQRRGRQARGARRGAEDPQRGPG